jgi:ABC-2 type transport system ATP-binding protein
MIEIWCDDPRQAAEVIRGTSGVKRINVYGDRLHVAMEKKDAVFTVIEKLKKESVAVKDYRDILPSIEDVFIEMVENR